jgi:hypothetical protein
MKKSVLKTKISKMDANDRALLVAGINASLATWDGHIPNNLRIDHNTYQLYAICPVREESSGIARMLRPILAALKAAKRRAK